MCKVLKVHHSGYYKWIKEPLSKRDIYNQVLLIHIKRVYEESDGIYGYRNIQKELKDLGYQVNKKRVARVMKEAGLFGVGAYKSKPRHKAGSVHKAQPNHLQRCFNAHSPNEKWVSDITYIRTYEGWVFLAMILDIYSRKIIGWATGNRQTTPLVIKALSMATHRLNKNSNVILHSDQGSQYSAYEYTKALEAYNITASMSRRGNCWGVTKWNSGAK